MRQIVIQEKKDEDGEKYLTVDTEDDWHEALRRGRWIAGGPQGAGQGWLDALGITPGTEIPSYRNPFVNITQNKYYVGEKTGPGATTCFDTGSTV